VDLSNIIGGTIMYISLVRAEKYDELWKEFKYLGICYDFNNEPDDIKKRITKQFHNNVKDFIEAKTIFDLPIYREKIHYDFFIRYINRYKFSSKISDKQLIDDYIIECQQFIYYSFVLLVDSKKHFIKKLTKPDNEIEPSIIDELLNWNHDELID
jgi:hypothetical protein